MSKSCLTVAGFNALPMHRKAVLVALDVLAHLRSQSTAWKVVDGYFTEGINKLNDKPEAIRNASTASVNGKQVILSAPCSVCAKGALFLSSIMRSNKMSIKDITSVEASGNSFITGKMVSDGIFTSEVLDLIEVAFEKYSYTWNEYASEEDQQDAMDFGRKYEVARHRLAAICLNIIRHKGTFLPTGYQPTLKNVKRVLVPKTVRA